MNLLVVGLDLESGLEVHIDERTVEQWKEKGHNGDRTLVCAECYAGVNQPGGSRVVGLVPKGRLGGARRNHFAHPPGLAPLGGRHHPETLWHAEGKQRLRRWALGKGAQARIEAWTPGGRRRSDVAILLPGGGQVAIEVQRNDISDAQWLARHKDYARAGIADMWVWNSAAWIPRVMFINGQPGWILDLERDRLGFIYAQPGLAAADLPPGPLSCNRVHWPPCPHDRHGVYWIALESAQLTSSGIALPLAAAAELDQQAMASAASATKRSPEPYAPPAAAERALAPSAQPSGPGSQRPVGLTGETHKAFKYESRPPWTDPGTWRHWCDACARSLTAAELDASPIFHVIPVSGRHTSYGQVILCHETRGGSPASH